MNLSPSRITRWAGLLCLSSALLASCQPRQKAALPLPDTTSGIITEAPAIIPAPLYKDIKPAQPGFLFKSQKEIPFNKASFKGDNKELAEAFAQGMADAGYGLKSYPTDKNTISLIEESITTDGELSPSEKIKQSESYEFTVTPTGINVKVIGTAGAYYAARTLAQAVVKDENGLSAIPSMTVRDCPRFSWRGLMIESARHSINTDEVKKMIDLMARYKMNTMHWHLTDDQGWRLEIKKHPRLTTVGSERAETPLLGNRNKGDGIPYKAHYTQEEVRDVVKYAKDRHITIVPEIEMPGHAAAAITAYPELGNTDIPDYNPQVVTRWGVFPYIFSPSEKTFSFLDDVMTEVIELFPNSPYIHVGGDEAPKNQWEKSAFAKEVMAKNNLKNTHELQSYFIRRAEEIINKKGKKLVGWDEIQEGGLSKTATMMVWRDWKWAKHALDNGNDIIMTPTSHCYLDYSEGKNPGGPEFDMIGGNVPMEKVYNLDPMPKDISADQQKKVLGLQANGWSEYMHTMAKREYLLFPRAIAMAEVAWSDPSVKNYDDFKTRWDKHKPELDKMKVNYRQDDGTPAQPDAPLSRKQK